MSFTIGTLSAVACVAVRGTVTVPGSYRKNVCEILSENSRRHVLPSEMNNLTAFRLTDLGRSGEGPEFSAAERGRLGMEEPLPTLAAAVERAIRDIPEAELRTATAPAADARLTLAVLVFSYAAGIYSSRDIRDQVLALPEPLARYRDAFPFRHEIVAFRRLHRVVLEASLARALQLRDQVTGWEVPAPPATSLDTANARRLIQLAVGLDSEDDGEM